MLYSNKSITQDNQNDKQISTSSSVSMEKDGISRSSLKSVKAISNISKECRSMSYDAMTAHTAVVFTRYMMLSLENRESNDNRSLGELFLYFSDEMSDITWIQAFQMLLQMFRAILSDTVELSETKIDELVDAFMSAIPTVLKSRLQAV